MRRVYRIAGSYDTETSNVNVSGKWHAFCSTYIMNDLRGVDLYAYEPDCPEESITFGRHEDDFHAWIDEMVSWGRSQDVVPVICAYNLMFDLQTVRYDLNVRYDIETTAQSASNVYTVDLLSDGEPVLRFWDTFHLEMGGLAAMGRTCGLDKLDGWDYDLIRCPETPLTREELEYAKRDVQVIPRYLRYLLEAEAWLEPDMLGSTVITKTSLVRQMARREIGKLSFRNGKGKRVKLEWAFKKVCEQDMPRTFHDHALRIACFRGGLTFTSATYASMALRNVASLDVVSMHHAFINGRRVPEQFRHMDPESLDYQAHLVIGTSLEDVLDRYDVPFQCAMHARFRFRGLRLREGSAFARWHIGLLAQGKFRAKKEIGFSMNVGAAMAENANRLRGWVDVAIEPRFAFGKLMSAKEAIVHLSELELWCMSRVYEWESMECILGEGTLKFRLPPDYVTLQSNFLYSQKNDAKRVLKDFEPGRPYVGDVPSTIPGDIAAQLRDGSASCKFLDSWYASTVKGKFNGIYGTQAQNVYRCDYEVKRGEWSVDPDSIVCEENWAEMRKDESMVLYPYGLRIVGGSRMHLICAIELIHDALGDRVGITGGDTDSLKVALFDATPHDVMRALRPLHDAVTRAIAAIMERPRAQFPDHASDLQDVGKFEVETVYEEHYEAWNKARVSLKSGRCHVTCAGLSRPEGEYTIESWIDDRTKEVGFARAASEALGYNTCISHSVSHSLQRTHPSAASIFDGDVTDHHGRTHHVRAHEAIALYPTSRELGETSKRMNRENVEYIAEEFGRTVDAEIKYVDVIEGRAVCERIDEIL